MPVFNNTVVTPNTVGARFSNAVPWMGQPAVFSQDGGHRKIGAFTGTGSAQSPGQIADDGSATGIKGTWNYLYLSEGTKQLTWASYIDSNASPWLYYKTNYAVGSLEPFPGIPSYYNPSLGLANWQSNPSFPGYYGYQDSPFGGQASGPDNVSMRDPSYFVVSCTQPANEINPSNGMYYISDITSIKTDFSSAYSFNTPTPLSSFSKIRSYRNKVNPGPTSIGYDTNWDVYGNAHTGPAFDNITFECMFWTYYSGNQVPGGSAINGQPVETNLDFGDGNLWNLFLSPSSQTTGGVSASYSFAIYCLTNATSNGPGPSNPDVGWVDLLSPLRYFARNYVVTSNGGPANPLDIPIWVIISGWEVANTGYVPAEFINLDFKLQLA